MASSISDSTIPAYIIQFLKKEFGEGIVANGKAQEMQSAQQEVWILSNVPVAEKWMEALETGNHHVVVRCWKGASRWWNLNNHHSDGVQVLALAEIAGYRVAHTALHGNTLQIPQVIFASFEDEFPWAIFTYVGPKSLCFTQIMEHDNYWFEGMVKVRLEFGFEEPHPRWGRVPSEEVLNYANEVLRTVTMPLHRFINDKRGLLDWSYLGNEGKGITYQDMTLLYRTALTRIMENTQDDTKVAAHIRALSQCIEHLHLESIKVHPLPPVLCHMDCQPQNLICYKERDCGPKILAILDWEEAAYADPRFELLLLARKVCANRKQADAIWVTYHDEFGVDLGDIEPWLKLETVHSLTTLVMQSMNLLGGGRNGWENKPDLDQKIQREFARLFLLGWDFCMDVAGE